VDDRRAIADLTALELAEIIGLGKLLKLATENGKTVRSVNRKLEHIMAKLADLEGKFDTLRTDVTRALGDLQAAVDKLSNGDLSAENQAVVDDMSAKLDELDAAVNAADPATPAAPAEPGA
jgi:outer membrane murein-binding lipoprotein Lpp